MRLSIAAHELHVGDLVHDDGHQAHNPARRVLAVTPVELLADDAPPMTLLVVELDGVRWHRGYRWTDPLEVER